MTTQRTAVMKPMSPASDAPTSQSGQALAEATIVLILVLLLLGGLVEFGWAYFRYLAMQDAAGEGAAYGIVYSTWQRPEDSPDPNNIVYRVQNESTSPILDWSSTTVDIDAPFTTPGNLITVTVSFEHQLITPLLSQFVSDGTITLRATAVQTILAPPPPTATTPP
jgi:Flp pilus assembly protein TadG